MPKQSYPKYIVVVEAKPGKLLRGGVRKMESSPFDTLAEAHDFQYAIEDQPNVGRCYIRSVTGKKENPFRLGQRRVYPVKGKRKPRYRGAMESRRKTYTTKRLAVMASNPKRTCPKCGSNWVGKSPYGDIRCLNCGTVIAPGKGLLPKPKKPNPSRRTIIYGRVIRIDAQKTQKHICDTACKRYGHKYTHGFKSGAKMYGLPNGDILISSR